MEQVTQIYIKHFHMIDILQQTSYYVTQQQCAVIISMLFVWNNFMKKRFTTKSNELISDFRRGHTSKP